MKYRPPAFSINTNQQFFTLAKSRGLKVVTELTQADKFLPVENNHQEYYLKTGKTPYCHGRIKKF
ncbi:peptide-methionine (S)-S-oxide reductase [candidate division WOR-3 bacterium]|nr:peptide-methionine (S)-S-oxide reductase [candidate division WOR-3 bacterium]